jgi:hypothetical protein
MSNQPYLNLIKKQWNEDVDLGDGQLQVLRNQYDQRILLTNETPKAATRQALEQSIIKIFGDIEDDIKFLGSGLETASNRFRDRMNKPTTSEQTLRCLN